MEIKLFNSKSFMTVLAGLLVVALGYMAVKTYKMNNPAPKPATYEQTLEKLESQSDSNALKDIEKDLNSTELENVDSELQDIEKELEKPSAN